MLFCIILSLSVFQVNAQEFPLDETVRAELEQNDKAIETFIADGDDAQAAEFLNKSAYLLWNNQQFEKATEYYKRALEYITRMNNRRGIMIINYNLGMIYSDMEAYDKALPYLEAGLKESRVIQEPQSIISGLTNVALALQGTGKHEQAIEKLKEAVGLATEISDLKLLRRCYGMMYESYEALGDADNAFNSFEVYNSYDKKLKRQEIEQVKNTAENQVNQANQEKEATERELNLKSEALRSTEDSLVRTKILTREQQMELELRELKIREQELLTSKQQAQLQTQRRTLIFVMSMAALILVFLIVLNFQFQQKKRANRLLAHQKQEIESYSQKLVETNHELEKLSIVASETDNAVVIMDAEGNYEWVNNGFTRMFGFTFEQLLKERQTNILGPKTPDDVREIIEECFNEKKTTNYEMTLLDRNENEVTVNTTLTPIVDPTGNIKKVIAIDSDISKIKAAERQIMRQRDTLHQQNQQITASIRYATNIQTAILPDMAAIENTFESFVFYRPKDMVSGDFYWFSEFNIGNKTKISFIAAVDCTGHGVPGAFMSMIGNRLLSEIVNERKVFEPSEILELLNIEVRAALRQEQTDNNDGMDVCLCKVEKPKSSDTYTVTFSGAKRPLYYHQKASCEIEIMKGDRKSIGGYGQNREDIKFTDQSITCKPGDSFYLTSDGIIDQNGPDRKRFGSKRLMKFFEEHCNQPMEEQHKQLNNEFDAFMGQEEQRDDITLIGIRLR
ncbi:MAG: SpoIIE family protein phosphatase [Bacteroidota bacterium]